MSDQDLAIKPHVMQVAIGVDESTQSLEPGPEWDSISGLYPALHEVHAIREQDTQLKEQGVLQRLAGKKKIDANPNQSVFSICQAFNGFGQFGYFVQTNEKLYFHTCEAPKDLHIDFATLQSLGVDEDGDSLDIFGHPPHNIIDIPDNQISCLFEFPSGDIPDPPNAAHPGVDYIIITVSAISQADVRLRTRLISLNSGTPYDNVEIGYYKTQNACRQDSVPLVTGDDGVPLYPPTNAKLAYMAWGGTALINTWTPSNASPQPNIWAQVANAWTQISAPTKSYFWRGYCGYHESSFSGLQFGQSYYVTSSNHSPGQRIYYNTAFGNSNSHWWIVNSNSDGHTGYYNIQPTSGPAIDFPNGGFPSASNSNRYGLQGTVIYQDFTAYDQTSPAWQEPFNTSYTITWTWTNSAARAAQALTSASVGKRGYQRDLNTHYQCNKFPTWSYSTYTAMQNSTHVAGDVGKYAHETDNDTWWALTQAGVTVNPTWTYPDAATRQDAYGFVDSDIGKLAHQLDFDTYWTLTNFNNHANKADLTESYVINLNRLFNDFQSITPVSIQFLLRGYFDKIHNSSGTVNITVRTYKGGLIVRNDRIMWDISGGTLAHEVITTKTCNKLVVNADAKGDNLASIAITMADGVIDVTTPSPNADGATPCPF